MSKLAEAMAEYDNLLQNEMAQPHWPQDSRTAMALSRKWLHRVFLSYGLEDTRDHRPYWATEVGMLESEKRSNTMLEMNERLNRQTRKIKAIQSDLEDLKGRNEKR